MKPSLQKLQNIFKIEADHNYSNRAVIGGIERYAENWESEARNDGLTEELIQIIGARLRDYPRLSEASRAEMLDGLWRRIQREADGSPPPSSPESERKNSRSTDKIVSPVVIRSEEPLSPPVLQPKVEVPFRLPPRQPVTETLEPSALNALVTVLNGIGPKNAQNLSKLGIQTLRDLLYYFPRRYDDYSKLKPINRLRVGEEVTVIGTLASLSTRQLRGNKSIVEGLFNDGTGSLRVSWFNQPWKEKELEIDTQYAIAGKVERYLGRLVMNNPTPEPIDHEMLNSNRIVPVYPLTENITQRWLRRQIHEVARHWAPRIPEFLPEEILQQAVLIDLPNAILQAHFPDSPELLKVARDRLAFNEIFLMQVGLLSQKLQWQETSAQVFNIDETWQQEQISSLPFSLTQAQMRALNEIKTDLASGHPMNRLLQGDVGSGKTVVAALAAAGVIQQSAQVALMAPTSILAEQHYRNLCRLLAAPQPASTPDTESTDEPLFIESGIRLLVGDLPELDKQMIYAGLEDGTIKVVIGTHALLEEPVKFKNLGLVIIDEQHRFGVQQRATLRAKGTNPHLLVMTATPIPRSLTFTIYGDLDLTLLDEMPPGRLETHTYVLLPGERERAYGLIKHQVEKGMQAFIIYPFIEDNEDGAALSAVEEYKRLQEDVFPHIKIGLLHGKLKAEEKDQIMTAFQAGEISILVSTSVVEVGVDVPNATVMLIEGANRFGLAQLHQFRGRVGRGGDQATCLLIPESSDQAENERLMVMSSTTDGFELAEKDLQQRGPGDFFGTRQSGYADLQFSSFTDLHLIEKARQHAHALVESDLTLQKPENQLLALELNRFWGVAKGEIS